MSSLIDRLKDLFSTGTPPEKPLPELDAAHALGALLVRVAKADQVYLFEELEQIDRILAERNDLNPVAAAKMRADCERLEASIPASPQFVEMLQASVAYEDRLAIVRALWKVVLADGIRQEDEVALVDLVQNKLGISDIHSHEAREAAQVIR